MHYYKYKQMFKNDVDKYVYVYYYLSTTSTRTSTNGGGYVYLLFEDPKKVACVDRTAFGTSRPSGRDPKGLVQLLRKRSVFTGRDFVRSVQKGGIEKWKRSKK